LTERPVIAVWFSYGAAGAVAAKKTIELYGNTHTIRVINNPVVVFSQGDVTLRQAHTQLDLTTSPRTGIIETGCPKSRFCSRRRNYNGRKRRAE
jgi:hypothetical protein